MGRLVSLSCVVFFALASVAQTSSYLTHTFTHTHHTSTQFVTRLKTDAAFAAWFQPLEESLADLLAGPCWDGAPPFPAHRWTRVLLLQQLLVEAFDLLDPSCLRIMPSRRMRLSPIAYKPLPNVRAVEGAVVLEGVSLVWRLRPSSHHNHNAQPPPTLNHHHNNMPSQQLEAYQARLSVLSSLGSNDAVARGQSSYEALANLRDPLAVARRGGALNPPGAGAQPGAGGIGGPGGGAWPLPPWASPSGGGSPGSGGGSPSASVDVPTALARAADALQAVTAGGGGGGDGGREGLLASKLPRNGGEGAAGAWSPVLPLAEVKAQMAAPHASGGAGGRPDSPALLQDVVGAALLQRLQSAQEKVAAAVAAVEQHHQQQKEQRQQQEEGHPQQAQEQAGGQASGNGGSGTSNGAATGRQQAAAQPARVVPGPIE